jgi:beta-fructofuranosidase
LNVLLKTVPTGSHAAGRYYQPTGRRVGDLIPFYWQGEHHLFFLDYGEKHYNHSPPGARRTPWGHLVTRDLVSYTRLPDAISPSDDAGAVDAGSCATGGVLAHEGRFYLYYTGRHFTARGKKREVICQAVSDDLVTWTKDPANPIVTPDPDLYGLENFRDPYVFYNDEARQFWMLVTADHADAVQIRRGCLALMVSEDLRTWTHKGPFWAPRSHFQHECPDVFRFGDWWYLIYSTDGRTHYRYAKGPNGPWQAPAVSMLDDGWFYAAKTSGDENRRLLWAWLATKHPPRDDGRREWGGSLACRELRQRPDGTLYADLPAEHRSTRGIGQITAPRGGPETRVTANGAEIVCPHGFASAEVAGVPADAQLRLRIAPAADTRAFGVILRSDPAATTGYAVRFEPDRRLVSLGSIDRPGGLRNVVSQPWEPPADGVVELTITCAGSVVDAVATGGGAVIGRFHDHRGESVHLFVEDGSASFSDIAAFDPLS